MRTVKMTFLRDTDLMLNKSPYFLDTAYYAKCDEVDVVSYKTSVFGTDMWEIRLWDGTEFTVLKESVEIDAAPLTK